MRKFSSATNHMKGLGQLQPGLSARQRKMKVAVLSLALLFAVLLCTPEDAQAFEASGGYCIGGGIGFGRVKRAAAPRAEKLMELARQRRMAEAAEA